LPNAILGYERSDPYRNGEYKFLKAYIKKDMLIFDVGANIGEYTQHILSIDPNVKIYCFEPVHKTYITLINNLSIEIKVRKVIDNNFGLSNEIKEAEIYIYDDLDGRNSLHFNRVHKYDPKVLHKEKVNLTTLSKYAFENNISKIDFLKIDVEGHESNVIEGANELIDKKLIKCIQFEYNDNWAAAGFKLEDIFNKLTKNGFKFYRLAIWGKIPIRRFNKKLENFKHANYVAILNE
jgi:FkbM family methyltransferase